MENTINPTPETVINTPIYIPPAKPKTYYFNLILISLAFVLFMAGIYYLGRQSVNLPETVSVPTSVLPKTTTVPKTTTIQDPTANWKTYRNTKYGFEFKYPSNIKYLDDKSIFSSNDLTGILILQDFPIAKSPNYSDEAKFQMMVYVKKSDGKQNPTNSNIFVSNDYVFFVENNLNKLDDKSLFPQILSTFKFTE